MTRETPPVSPINVGPTHPAWIGLDDDDWNAAAFANWLRSVQGKVVALQLPKNARSGLLDDMIKALRWAGATEVITEEPMNAATTIPEKCNACGRPLLLVNLFVDDGCPCNSPRGVNFTPQPCGVCKTDNCVKIAHRVGTSGLPL